MQELLIADSCLAPAKACWNHLRLDRALPLAAQLDALDEDLLLAEFPNGVCLDIGWYGGPNPEGEFGIVLVKSKTDWEPFLEKRCRS
ncbi:MAG TPA: hypothetical protein VG734_14680, partial [Lacunisphaera sp.]|nr:hypothetical protein [Lacunisphaera sp.]